MKLQQIKLAGFKSFVDNTNIEVHGQLVGIVGPNGCGKSNVIDAVRWVLGESSAKQLRGESMADVIFNGSIKRKPISRATVELVFDNTAKSFYGLWNNYNEISIKRLISRQGESNYYINNQQVRRKDITELFLGTGVGTKGYAVIEQGMISKIIESKPEDMRLFVEEAAGVSKYRERRKETLQRLSDTHENLQRLEDIHGELIKQLGTLHEQAQVAELHQRLTSELKHQQTLSLAIKVTDANKILGEANQFIAHCEEELRVLGYQLEETSLSLTAEQDKKAEREQILQNLMQQFNEYRTNLARVEERFKHYSDLLKRFETESVDLATKERDLEQDISELTLQGETIAEQIEDNQFTLSEQTLAREELQLQVDEKHQAYSEIAALLASRQDVMSNSKHDLALLQNSLNHKRQQQNNLSTRLARLSQEGQSLDFDQNYHFIKEEIELVEEELIATDLAHEDKTLKIEKLEVDLAALQQEVNLNHTQHAASSATIQTLEQLLANSSSNDETASCLPDTELSEVWQHLQVTAGYELAVEVALANVLNAKLIQSLNQLKQLPASELALWLANTTPSYVTKGSLSEFVQIQHSDLNGLYNYLNAYCLIDDLKKHHELEIGKFGVTREGHLATRDYIIYHATSGGNNLLQHQQQLQQELVLRDELQLSSESLDEKLAAQQIIQQNLRNDISSLAAKHKRLQHKQHELQLEFTKQEQIYLQNQRHQERVAQESSLLQQELAHLTSDIESLSIQYEDKQISLEDLQVASQDVELEKLERETSWQLAKNKLHEADTQANKMIMDNQLFQQQRQNTLNLVEEKRLQLSAARQKLGELSSERETFNSNDQAQEIIQLQQQIGEIAKQMQSVQEAIDELANKIIVLKNKAASLNSNYQRNLEKINQTKFKQQEQNILLSTYQENLAGLDLSSAQLELLLEQNQLSLSELIANCKSLDTQIAELGLVNLKAIEDLAAANGKEQELLGQIDDLKNATATLQEAIEHIDSETRKLLQTTFDQLNDAIVVYFRTLFGGGNARLALTDKDILVAGIQIYAEPPGKKNSTIHLLSGGEKALAAMSFIFALFSLNPAPFCLLDEVDAPLDDANTQRFCNLVQELSNKTQFVYISHNRLAMEMADQLVGVTMQEKGVSTVVSVNLVEAVQHAQQATE